MQRSFLAIALLASLGPAATGAAPDRESREEQAMSQFQGIMATSQMQLIMAQSQHDKVLKKTRKQVASLLVQEGKRLGEAIGRYASELAEASQDLQVAINVSQKQVAASEAAASADAGPDSWMSPGSQARSKLTAGIHQAEHIQKQNRMDSDFAVHSAVEHSEEAMEEDVSSLERKLGDLSPLIDEAKRALEAGAGASGARQLPNATANVTLAGNLTATSSLGAAGSALTAAMKRSKNEVDAANGRLDKIISRIRDQVVNNATDIKASMEKAEEKELRRFRGGSAKAAPVKKTSLIGSASTGNASKTKTAPSLRVSQNASKTH